MFFPVVMYGCESCTIKEGWAPKNWCFWTVVLEKTLESLLDSKEIQLVNPEGNQPWIFIGKTDAEAETPIFWPPDANSWLIWKDLDSGKDWGQEEKWMTEDVMVGWHHPSTQWTWVWVNSGSWWWTGRPGVLQFMRWQRVGHGWVTELNRAILFTTPPKIVRIVFYSFIKSSLFTALWKAELAFIILKAKQWDKNNCICFRGPNT